MITSFQTCFYDISLLAKYVLPLRFKIKRSRNRFTIQGFIVFFSVLKRQSQ